MERRLKITDQKCFVKINDATIAVIVTFVGRVISILADVGHFQEVERKTGSELCRIALLDLRRSDERNLKKLSNVLQNFKG